MTGRRQTARAMARQDQVSVHTMTAQRKTRCISYSSTYANPRHWMIMSGQLNAPATLK